VQIATIRCIKTPEHHALSVAAVITGTQAAACHCRGTGEPVRGVQVCYEITSGDVRL
jgi:hypothetical protein